MSADPTAVDAVVIGRSIPRKDTRDRVTGHARYAADIRLPNLLRGAVLRSPHHHARIRSIDITRAASLPGVAAVLTAADIPGHPVFGALIADQPPLASDRVRHKGEPVALVVAATIDQARAACREIAVEYEPLPAVLDLREALLPGAPAVHASGNLCDHYALAAGDVDRGLAEADLVVEETFELQRVSPAYLEAETSLASWQPDDSLVVWTGSQKPFFDRAEIASVLGLEEEKIVVRSAEVGGAFGGKEDSMLAILASLAAWKTRGNVLVANERGESFLGHPKRHPAVVTLKVGVKKDGALTAFSARGLMDTGAYASYGPAVASQFTEMLCGAYRIPHIDIAVDLCYTNTPLAGAMRGFGNPQAAFAIESMMDILAEKLELDPLDLRERNFLKRGDRMATGLEAGAWVDALPGVAARARQALRELNARPAPPDDGCPRRAGVGLAVTIQPMGLGRGIPDRSTHSVEWLPDGSIRLGLGAPEIGQGLSIVAEQMLAEALGVPCERVRAERIDTALIPNGGVTCASRMTYLVGNALFDAAANLKTELLARTAALLGTEAGALRYERGLVLLPDGQPPIPAEEIAARLAEQNQALKVTGSADFPEPANFTRADLPVGMPHALFVAGAQVARVEVDPEVGSVTVTDLIAIHDAGRVINPATAEGQVQGGVAMGLGYALLEDMPLKTDGNWVSTFAEYLLPTCLDLPPRVQTVFLESPQEGNAFGAKGLGEAVLAPTAPAVANAVARAAGKRVTCLPIKPEKLV